MEENSEFLLIPRERIGALIGQNGSIKKDIEKKTETELNIDSNEGEVEIFQKGEPFNFLKAVKIVKAIGRGFSPEHAFRLLSDDCIFELIDLTDKIGKNKGKLNAKRGRIIGSKGKAREKIESNTGANISVFGKTIGIIGKEEEVEKARKAIEMLIGGSTHFDVYDSLEKKRFKEKFEL